LRIPMLDEVGPGGGGVRYGEATEQRGDLKPAELSLPFITSG
jgi:hypothetical protein